MAMSKLPGAAEKDPVNTELEDILTCPICLSVITRPKTLGCFHSFCTPCIDEYGRQKDKGGATIPCPVCRHVTKRGEEPRNFLVNDILDWHKTNKTKNRDCGYCAKKSAEFTCIDCKLDLCLECKENHHHIPILKNHRIIPISEQKGVMLDNLVFCHKHGNELIRFNCKKCESVLCIECKVLEHEGHKTENIEAAVGRLTPVIKAKIEALKQVIEAKKEGVKVIGQNKEDLIAKQKKAKDELKSRKLEVIAYVEKGFDEIYKVMDDNQNQEAAKIDDIQAQEENTIKEMENVVQWVNTMFDTAMNASLLNTCQGGLREKLERLEINCKKQVQRGEGKIQWFIPAESMPSKDELLGKVSFYQNNANTNNTNVNRRFIKSGLIPSLISAKWKKNNLVEKKDNKQWHRIWYVNGNMWLPCPEENSIYMYTHLGEFVRTLTHNDIKGHRAVIEVNGDVILASDSGLHVLFPDGMQKYIAIAEACCDVCYNKDHVYALQCYRMSVNILHYECNKWQCVKRVEIEYFGQEKEDSLCVQNEYMLVCSWERGNIMKLSMEGKLIQKYGSCGYSLCKPGLLNYPCICYLDGDENMLVADRNHNCYQIMDKSGQWSVVTLEELTRPIDIVFTDDNTLWCLCESGKRLTQYIKV